MGYSQTYWEKNGEEIKKERRERYHTDPEYREKAKERAREYRRQQREAQGIKDDVVKIGKVEVPGIPSQDIYDDLGIDSLTVKKWQKRGFCPPALRSRPVRLYTQFQVDLLDELNTFLRSHDGTLKGPAGPDKDAVKQELDMLVSKIHSEWERVS